MVLEAEKHRQLERRYRRMELELSSVDSYLEGLPPEKVIEMKVALAQKYFGQIEEPAKTDREERRTSNKLFKLVEELIKHYTASK